MRGISFERKAVEYHLEVVFVYTCRGIAEIFVALERRGKPLSEVCLLQYGRVRERYLFVPLRYAAVEISEYGYKIGNKLTPTGKYRLCFGAEFVVEYLEQCAVDTVGVFEHSVARTKGGIVCHKVLEIFSVVLRDDYVHKPSALVAALVDKRIVGRRYEYEWNFSDMLREAFVLFLVV